MLQLEDGSSDGEPDPSPAGGPGSCFIDPIEPLEYFLLVPGRYAWSAVDHINGNRTTFGTHTHGDRCPGRAIANGVIQQVQQSEAQQLSVRHYIGNGEIGGLDADFLLFLFCQNTDELSSLGRKRDWVDGLKRHRQPAAIRSG